jgi:DNA-binding beta-propeller fold protein YncE
VANFGGATISQYDADAAGKLTPKTPPTVPSAPGSFSITTTPDGKNLYVANLSSGSVSQYDVAADGKLTPKTPAAVMGLSSPAQVLVTPDGRHAYVPNNGNSTVAQFDIGAGGKLVARTPATVPGGTAPGKAALTPDGRNLYVGNFGGATASQYGIGATGLLTALTPPTLATGTAPRGVALTPNQGPRAVFAAAAAPRGPVAAFDGSGSTDPDGTVARYDWDFGDGTTAANGGATPSHTYAAGGTYTVKLTVTDDGGCSDQMIFTAQTTLCNGSAAGHTTRSVTVAPPEFGAGTLVSLKLAVKKIRANGRVAVRIANGNTFAVTGRLSGKTAQKITVSAKRRVALKSKRFTVAAHGRKTVRLKLPKSLQALLASRHKLSLVVTAKVKDPAGHSRTVRKRVAPKLRR